MSPRHKKHTAPAVVLGAIAVLGGVALWIACGRLTTRTPPVETGATAPELALPDQNDRMISLDDLTARGPAVIVFYRGHW